MKVFSLFLPQYYETKENNEWWGKGFTEWTHVKSAKPFFKNHNQPLHPLNDNYYNLLDKETMQWQTELMKKYGLYGMIYYHYYFNGKKLLEKPAENLLKWTDINQPFFFCWANHSWYRSWEGSKQVLVEQTYGNEEDWKKHFDYLLPFFLDSRYEKKDNKPLLMIYDNESNKHIIDNIIVCFDKWCLETGFDGITIIRECFHYPTATELEQYSKDEYIYITQPLCGRAAYEDRTIVWHYFNRLKYRLLEKGRLQKPPLTQGNKVYNTMISKVNQYPTRHIIPGIFFQWDNTPRHKNRGHIINLPDKELFMNYMNSISTCEYAIINAWNEWAEGMIMEPTNEYGYSNLEWVKEWLDQQEVKGI